MHKSNKILQARQRMEIQKSIEEDQSAYGGAFLSFKSAGQPRKSDKRLMI